MSTTEKIPSLVALDSTWEDCLDDYKQLLAKMKPWDVNCPPHIDRDAILSSPEMMDPKTDTGFNWLTVGSLSAVFAADSKNPPRDVSTLTADELVDLLDVLFAKESLYLQGRNVLQSFLSFIYIHRMDLLGKRHHVLHLYVRAMLRTLLLVVQYVSAPGIRDDEENMILPPELPLEQQVQTEQLLAELELFSNQAQDPRIKARLTFRRQFLHMLHSVTIATTSKPNAEKWFGICKEGLKTLEGLTRQDSKEPAVDPSLFRHEESRCWYTVMSVQKELPTPTFKEAVGVHRTILTHLSSLSHLLEIQHLHHITDFVEAFAMKKPLLVVRCMTALFFAPSRADETFLFRSSIMSWLWRMFDKAFGAPLYGLLIANDEATVRDVVNFRLSKLSPDYLHNPQAMAELRDETIGKLRDWGSHVCQQLLMIWMAILCNRGRCHRRLQNMLGPLMDLQRVTLDIETRLLLVNVAGVANVSDDEQRALIHRSAALSNFVIDLVAQVMHMIVSLTVQLDLLTPAEFLPVHWYLNYLNGVRQENFTKLYTAVGPQVNVPTTRLTSKRAVPILNPALTTRQSTFPMRSTTVQVNLNRMLAEATCHAVCALNKKGLIDLSLPKMSLVTPDVIFNNRFRAFHMFRQPVFVPYQTCIKALESDMTRGDATAVEPAEIIKMIVLSAKRCADDAKQFASGSGLAAHEVEFVQAAERTARSLSASLSMIQAMDEESIKKFKVSLEAPYRASFMTIVLKRNV